jgi:hypothetical protein
LSKDKLKLLLACIKFSIRYSSIFIFFKNNRHITVFVPQWDDAIAVAEARSHPDLETMRSNYTDWLLSTGQEEKAGELRETEGDLQGALNFFMKAGLPGRYFPLLYRA